MSSLKIDCVNTPKKLLYHRVRIKYYNVICESCKGCWGVPKWLSATSWNFGTLTLVLMKTSWRRLWSSSSQDVFKTSWSRRIYSPYSYVFRRRLQDVFIKTNIFVLAIRLQNVLKTSSRRLQDIFKTSSRRFENVFKTSSRRFQDLLSS